MISGRKNNLSISLRFFLAGAVAVCLLFFATGDAVSIEPVRPEKILFENGMRLIVAEMPASDMVSVYGFVDVGSTMEGPFLGTGLSHFLEHMIFKGTLTRKPGDIPDEIQSLGGVINASTGLDYTIYTITVPAVSFSKGLDILADMLMNAVIDEGEFDREKEVVLSELKMYKDSPDRYLSEMTFSNVYRVHPYKVPIIGYEPLLRSLTAQQMRQHYKKFYAPNNIVLVVAGGVKKDEVVPLARAAFEKFERTPVSLRDFPQEPVQKGSRFYSEGYPTPLTRMSLAYRGVNVFHDDMAALDALAMVLGQGASSRLYRELVQRQSLVQSVSASNFTPVGDGVFEIEVSFMDVPLDRVREEVLKQVRAIQRSGISKEELLKAKKAVWKDYWQRQETSSSLAHDLAVSEGLFGDSSFSLRYVKAFDRLTVKEIQQAARRYLVDESLTVTALTPQTQEPSGPGPDSLNFDKDAVDAVRL
ncbi:MAG TPA: pitrilysin family protein, partial [Candidatus Omnitrophota bacterium]|nr:pitrilysin family protein [Candidatus Omnitrophota bacterium]